ncbi:MAG: hypothetical protein JSV66_00900 [Trueperaceae bacterium]|nr:MAG: hypothetical protein JSV66_00900 [Trueperaceae bacterium]
MVTLDVFGFFAQRLVELALNGLIPGLAITLLVWVTFRIWRPSAATKYTIWMTTLLLVVVQPVMGLIDLTPLSAVVTPSETRHSSGAPLPVEGSLPSAGALTAQSEAVPPPRSSLPAFDPVSVGDPAAGPLWRPLRLPHLISWFLLGAYLMGAAILLVQCLRSYLSLAQLKRTSNALAGGPRRLVETPLQAGRRRARLRSSNEITVPMVAGLVRPTILIPEGLHDQLSKDELEHVILHELAHLARYDDWTKVVQQVLLALLFFHPALHVICWQLDLEREIASDDWVIARRGRPRHGYARSLMRLVELALHRKRMRRPLVEGSAVMVKTQIERRITLLLDRKRSIGGQASRAALVAASSLLLVSGLVLIHFTPALARAIETPRAVVITAENATNLALHGVLDSRSVSLWAVDFHPDDSLLAGAGDDGYVWLWDLKTLEPLRERIKPARVGLVRDVTFSPDGTLLAAADLLGSVTLWRVDSLQQVGKAMRHDSGFGVNRLAFSPDGRLLASGSQFGDIVLWEVATQRRVGGPLRHGEVGICELAFNPAGTLLASGARDNRIVLWDVGHRQPVAEPLLETGTGTCGFAFSPDGSRMAGGSAEQIHVWTAQDRRFQGERLSAGADLSDVPLWEAVFSPDGRLLASAADNGVVRLWNVETRSPAGPALPTDLDGFYRHGMADVAFSSDGTLLATTNWGGDILLWGVAPHEPP